MTRRDPGLAQAAEAPWTFAAPWGARGHLWRPNGAAGVTGTASATGVGGMAGAADGACKASTADVTDTADVTGTASATGVAGVATAAGAADAAGTAGASDVASGAGAASTADVTDTAGATGVAGVATAAGAADAAGTADTATAADAVGTAVHWIEFGASGAGPPMVFVHGLGGSHLNWTLIGPALATGRRAVALDLYGFGLTPGSRDTATVSSNAALLDRFLREVAGTPAILVGNSMGGLLSILQAHAHPGTVAGLVLIAPALPPARQRPDWTVSRRFLLYATPGLGEFYLRLAQARVPPRVAVQRVIDLCFADPSRAAPAMMTASTALAEYRRSVPGGDESLLAAARSLMRMLAQRARYEAMMAAIEVPVLLIGGDQDRLVPVASVRRAAALNPGWESHILPGVGHTAQLETPDLVIGAVRDWLDRHGTLTAH